jgi:hypothetical protein
MVERNEQVKLDQDLFQVGSKVTIYAGEKKNLIKPKFGLLRKGPYVITHIQHETNTYRCQHMHKPDDVELVNVKWLEPYKESVKNVEEIDTRVKTVVNPWYDKKVAKLRAVLKAGEAKNLIGASTMSIPRRL